MKSRYGYFVDFFAVSLFFLGCVVASILPPLFVSCFFISFGVIFLGVYWWNYGTPINIKSLFSGIWSVTIGLSALRIHPLQVKWNGLTWVCVFICFALVVFGYDFCSCFPCRLVRKKEIRANRVLLVLWGLLPIIGFILDVAYSKVIPVFSYSQSAYKNFGMPYAHYLTVFSGIYPALVISEMGQRRINYNDKVLILLCLVNVLIPILIVSRQLTLMQIIMFGLSFLISFKFVKKIRVRHVLLTFFAIIAVFLLSSLTRNQNDAYIKYVFDLPSDCSPIEMFFWRIYMYIAFNYDNFNNLVTNCGTFFYGIKMLYPFAVLVGAGSLIPDGYSIPASFQLLPTHNTFTILSSPYMDFGIVGVAVFSLVVGVAVGYFENQLRQGVFTNTNVVLYSLLIYSIIICFFVNEFSFPVFWVYILLLLVYQLLTNTLKKKYV